MRLRSSSGVLYPEHDKDKAVFEHCANGAQSVCFYTGFEAWLSVYAMHFPERRVHIDGKLQPQKTGEEPRQK